MSIMHKNASNQNQIEYSPISIIAFQLFEIFRITVPPMYHKSYKEEYSKHCVFYRFIVFVKASQAVLSIIRHTFLLIQHLGKSFE